MGAGRHRPDSNAPCRRKQPHPASEQAGLSVRTRRAGRRGPRLHQSCTWHALTARPPQVDWTESTAEAIAWKRTYVQPRSSHDSATERSLSGFDPNGVTRIPLRLSRTVSPVVSPTARSRPLVWCLSFRSGFCGLDFVGRYTNGLLGALILELDDRGIFLHWGEL